MTVRARAGYSAFVVRNVGDFTFSVAARNAGLRKTKRLAEDLREALKTDGVIGADRVAVNVQLARATRTTIDDLQRLLSHLGKGCHEASKAVKSSGTRAREPFEDAADLVGSFYSRGLRAIPSLSKKSSYLEVLHICCQELRGKRTTIEQVRPHAKLIAKLAKTNAGPVSPIFGPG